MRSVGWGEVIAVVMIGFDFGEGEVEMEVNEATFWIGGNEIRPSEMRFGAKACTVEMCWIRGVGTSHVMIGMGTGAVNFSTSGALFVATSFISSGSQKKENSDFGFRCDANEVETFDGEAFSLESSASGFQKNKRLETAFVHGDTGDEMTFLGGAIQSLTTC